MPAMPDHALTVPLADAKSNSLDMSFVYSTVRIWNSFPDAIVGDLSVTGLNSFKHEFLLNRPLIICRCMYSFCEIFLLSRLSSSFLCLGCSEPFDWPSGVLYFYTVGLLFALCILYTKIDGPINTQEYKTFDT